MFAKSNLLGTCLGLGLLAGCGPLPSPDNIGPIRVKGGYQAQYRDPDARTGAQAFLVAERMNAETCVSDLAGTGNSAKGGLLTTLSLNGERLSHNDLVDIRIGDDETFNGDYVVSRDGTLKLPFLPPVRAQGRSTNQIEAEIARLLVSEGLYEEAPRISVRVADFASIKVSVSGAVFEPHAMEIGQVSGDEIDRARQAALGSSTEARNLSVALRSAGGVRPDADLSRVELHRGGKRHIVDMRGVFEGRHSVDVTLLTGDEVVVPSRQCFQDDLMRPSPISPPGVSLYMSNLTQPATGNAVSAIGQSVRAVPYGTRFMQAVVDTNCVGGARASSAYRSAVLFTRNPITGVSTVIERRIEDQMRRPDRDDYDPYLLPGDAIACYDSNVTNLAEVARVVGIVGIAAAIVP
ncbi:polysaccharide biosynthesis/export family protein [Pelagimonas varians]|uniref:Polysaccharide biosynthesis/export protein n=1 Tax=Pelagimonas varians TaxID=696760 RepID=A0A238K6M4_9RHOB|nr:polysaccharide biosynthesis/export family protein [Pelagimonas varians]PYG31904.1 protein involved in polysaccharide export with SLBB domain [Pelagimonas varians]SMX38453.1 Polysaccharide biosynthesis/export protein [Pelagimonas varians]